MDGIDRNRYFSIDQINEQYFGKGQEKKVSKGGMDFAEILKQTTKIDDNETREVHFSKHAANRLSERNIELTESQKERLNEGTCRASEKGIKDSLIMVDQLAFIVNVPNNTVVTAMDSTDTDDAVFTNIDGAVIV